MSTKMNPVVHFELPAKDKKRMMGFYGNVFGWQTQQLGEQMGNYVVATTTEVDEKTHFPKEPGRINGGFYDSNPDMGATAPTVVIAVDDIQEHMKKVTDAGGKITSGPDDIPGIGKYVAFVDTEGNRIAMLQPSGM